MKIKNCCATCEHNLNKSGLDCEFYCAGVSRVRRDKDGTVYATACDDYEMAATNEAAEGE